MPPLGRNLAVAADPRNPKTRWLSSRLPWPDGADSQENVSKIKYYRNLFMSEVESAGNGYSLRWRTSGAGTPELVLPACHGATKSHS